MVYELCSFYFTAGNSNYQLIMSTNGKTHKNVFNFEKSRPNTTLKMQKIIQTMPDKGKSSQKKNFAQKLDVNLSTVFNMAKRKPKVNFLPEHTEFIKKMCDRRLPLNSSTRECIFKQFKEKFPEIKVSYSTFSNYVRNDMKYTRKLVKHMDNGRNDMESIIGRFLLLQIELIDQNTEYRFF